MPLDFSVNEQFDTEWNEVGDVQTVSGNEYVQQCVVISIVENVGLHVGSLQATSIEEHRGAIEEAVRDNHATSNPISVTVAEIGEENQSVTYAIETNETEFALGTQ